MKTFVLISNKIGRVIVKSSKIMFFIHPFFTAAFKKYVFHVSFKKKEKFSNKLRFMTEIGQGIIFQVQEQKRT